MSVLQELARGLRGLFQWWVVVAPWERAMRVRGGKRSKLLGPGIHLRVPMLDRIFRQSVRERAVACKSQTLGTADGKTISVTGFLLLAIEDLEKLYETLHSAEDTLRMRAVKHIPEFISTRRREEITPEKLAAYVNARLAFERYGVGGAEYVVTEFVDVPYTIRLLQHQDTYVDGNMMDTTKADGEA